MSLSSSQRLIVIILLLASLSGGGVLGYRIMKEYPEFTLKIEEPIQVEEPLPQKPVVVTEKVPIEKLGAKDKEKLRLARRININTASSEELQKIPYIGPKKAEAIIAGRPYSRIEDIMNVPGFGEKTFEKIKDHITVK